MESKIVESINRHHLITPGDLILVGVSGGPDSVALLHVLSGIALTMDFKVCIAHLNHCMRGETAWEDAQFVENLAKDYGLDFYYREWPVKKMAEKEKLSPQQAARTMRYKFYYQMACECGANKIALGHHRDDQVETFLYRLIRGAGLQGLSGMPIARKTGNITIIRPLLYVSKNEVLDYLKQNNLPYKKDPTNKEIYYLRNKIRHTLVPSLRKLNPAIEERIFETTMTLAEENEYMDQRAGEIYEALKLDDVKEIDKSICFPLQNINDLSPPLLRRVVLKGIYEKLAHENLHIKQDEITKKHLEKVQKLALNEKKGKMVNLPGNLNAGIQDVMVHGQIKTYLTLSSQSECSKRKVKTTSTDSQLRTASKLIEKSLNYPGWTYWPLTGDWLYSQLIKTPMKGQDDFQRLDTHEFSDRGKNQDREHQAFLDFGQMTLPLRLRPRMKGDRLNPLGMSKAKKIKNFFIDEKIPAILRDKIPLLVDGKNRIIWICGYRVDERFKVTESTQEILFVQKVPPRVTGAVGDIKNDL